MKQNARQIEEKAERRWQLKIRSLCEITENRRGSVNGCSVCPLSSVEGGGLFKKVTNQIIFPGECPL
jgi:hypothetical protein